MTPDDTRISGPFYHGTKADLKPGDLIAPGYRTNYGQHGERTSPWVYMTATLSPWGAELAKGDGPGRLYVVEPTGPFTDDPDLTDKRFPGNPTKSYRTRDPLRVIGEVTDWEPHSPEEIQRMLDGQARLMAVQAGRVAQIPTADDFDAAYAQTDALARAWASDAEYVGSTLLMVIHPEELANFSAMTYRSATLAETHTIELPSAFDGDPGWNDDGVAFSGRVTDVTAWRDGWQAVIESCVTEIGLSLETHLWIAPDAVRDTLVFRLDADGPERSWQRNLRIVGGLLSDDEHGDIWDFAADRA